MFIWRVEVWYGVLRVSGVRDVFIAEVGGAFPAFCVMNASRVIRRDAPGVSSVNGGRGGWRMGWTRSLGWDAWDASSKVVARVPAFPLAPIVFVGTVEMRSDVMDSHVHTETAHPSATECMRYIPLYLVTDIVTNTNIEKQEKENVHNKTPSLQPL